jgi:hypothetical protein
MSIVLTPATFNAAFSTLRSVSKGVVIIESSETLLVVSSLIGSSMLTWSLVMVRVALLVILVFLIGSTLAHALKSDIICLPLLFMDLNPEKIKKAEKDGN